MPSTRKSTGIKRDHKKEKLAKARGVKTRSKLKKMKEEGKLAL